MRRRSRSPEIILVEASRHLASIKEILYSFCSCNEEPNGKEMKTRLGEV